MRLEGRQVDALCTAIGNAYDVETFRMFLSLRLNRNLDIIILADNLKKRIFGVIEASQKEGWTLPLLEALKNDSGNAALQAVLAEILAGAPITPAVALHSGLYDTCLVGKRAFVNRETLRINLQKLVRDDYRILAIRGPSASGKSYSWYFINHLAKALGHARVLVDMKDWTKAGGPLPDDVMESIVGSLGFDREGWPPNDLAQGARRGKKLADWFAGRSGDLPRPLWLVMDHLDIVNLQDDTLELAEKLALAIHRDLCENVFLVLVGFPRALHLDLEPLVFRDDARPLGQSEVRLHFENLARQKSVSIDSDAVDALLNKAFFGLTPPLDREGMSTLSGRVAQLSVGLVEVAAVP